MKLITLVLAIASVVAAALNTTREYRLRTVVKHATTSAPEYGAKTEFNDLWM
jgi:hypothetical protein